jgi:hypothetical protein
LIYGKKKSNKLDGRRQLLVVYAYPGPWPARRLRNDKITMCQGK